MFLLKCIVILYLISAVHSSKKLWIPSTNYNDPLNWVNSLKPCETSRIVFPTDLESVVVLPEKQIVLRELLLPINGELVLPEKGSVEFVKMTSTKTCTGEDVYFKSIKIESWLNPTNWQNEYESNTAIPHLEQIPCLYDDVIFKRNATFFVKLPEYPMIINSVSINGNNLTNNQLQEFLKSDLGTKQFQSQSYLFSDQEITITKSNCNDKSGCKCHSYSKDRYQFLEDNVCGYVIEKCLIPHCLDPVQPIGHCCKICGSFLLLKYNDNFNAQILKKLISNSISELSYPLNYYVSKVTYKDSDHIQIIIREKNEYVEYSTEFATILKQKIVDDESLGLSILQLQISGAHYQPENQSSSVKIIFESLFIVVITMAIIYLIFYPIKGTQRFMPPIPTISVPSIRPFLFARFENQSENDTTLEFRNQSVASSLFNLEHAFDNPLYGNESEAAHFSGQSSDDKKADEEKTENFKDKAVFSELMKLGGDDTELVQEE